MNPKFSAVNAPSDSALICKSLMELGKVISFLRNKLGGTADSNIRPNAKLEQKLLFGGVFYVFYILLHSKRLIMGGA